MNPTESNPEDRQLVSAPVAICLVWILDAIVWGGVIYLMVRCFK